MVFDEDMMCTLTNVVALTQCDDPVQRDFPLWSNNGIRDKFDLMGE